VHGGRIVRDREMGQEGELERGRAGKLDVSVSQNILQLVADVSVFVVIVDMRIMSDERVLGADVDGVIDLPIDVPYLAGWVEQTLQTVL